MWHHRARSARIGTPYHLNAPRRICCAYDNGAVPPQLCCANTRLIATRCVAGMRDAATTGVCAKRRGVRQNAPRWHRRARYGARAYFNGIFRRHGQRSIARIWRSNIVRKAKEERRRKKRREGVAEMCNERKMTK